MNELTGEYRAKNNTPSLPEAVDLSNVTDDDLRRECKEGLVLLVRNNKGNLAALAAIRELLNRIDGTPAQTLKIDASVEVKASILPPTEAKQRIALIEEEIRRRSMIDVTPVKLIE